MQVFYCFGNDRKYMLAIDTINILDEKYADYTGGGAEKKYSPGLPLSVYATFTVTYQSKIETKGYNGKKTLL